MKAKPSPNKHRDPTSESRTPPSSKRKEMKEHCHWSWKTRKYRKPSSMLVLLLAAVKQCLNHQQERKIKAAVQTFK